MAEQQTIKVVFDLTKVLSQKANNLKKSTEKRHAETLKFMGDGFSNIKGTDIKVTDNVFLNALIDLDKSIKSETLRYELARTRNNAQKRIIKESLF